MEMWLNSLVVWVVGRIGRFCLFDLSMGEECAPSWWTFFRGWTSDDGISGAFKKTRRSKNGWSLTTQMMESIWPWWPAWHTATSRLQQESFKCLWFDPSFQYQKNGVYWFFLPGSSRWFCTTLCYSFAMRLLILACGSSMWTEWPPAFCGPGCAWSDAHYLHIHLSRSPDWIIKSLNVVLIGQVIDDLLEMVLSRENMEIPVTWH